MEFRFLSYRMARLVLFFHSHNRERFRFSELDRMGFFPNSSELSNFLKFGVRNNLIKRTEGSVNGRTYALYEIKAEANLFAEFLERFMKKGEK